MIQEARTHASDCAPLAAFSISRASASRSASRISDSVLLLRAISRAVKPELLTSVDTALHSRSESTMGLRAAGGRRTARCRGNSLRGVPGESVTKSQRGKAREAYMRPGR
jgi:hypothetical protein